MVIFVQNPQALVLLPPQLRARSKPPPLEADGVPVHLAHAPWHAFRPLIGLLIRKPNLNALED